MRARLQEAFRAMFGAVPRIYRAPGRVNLIGEHTDYNGGFVMPAAIEFAAWAAVSNRADRKLVVHSENFGETCQFPLPDGRGSVPKPSGHWSDYVRGVAVMLEREGAALKGANLLIRSQVPMGAGLSSSAALEVAVSWALAPNGMDGTQRTKLCQRAENEFVGVRCGIMDQFVACHARAGNALLLDCRGLEYHYAPLPSGVKMVIANSMVRHSLAEGEYNRRREECAEAAAYFGRGLRDVNLDELNRASLPDVLLRRARHVVTENARVLEACGALDRCDLSEFGRLMYESHRSLRDDFEVSCAELDALVEIARGVEGVYGSRMTGGGFGGCTISLVAADRVDALRAAIQSGYPKAEVYVSDAAEAGGPVEIVNL